MTTRFFDFRKYAYKRKESESCLPVLKRKISNTIVQAVKSDDEAKQKVSKYSSKQVHSLSQTPPLQSSPRNSSASFTQEDLIATPLKSTIIDSQPKRIPNDYENFENLYSLLTSNSPLPNEIDKNHNAYTKHSKNNQRLYDNCRTSPSPDLSEEDSPVAVRKRLKRFLGHEDEKEEENAILEVECKERKSLPIYPTRDNQNSIPELIDSPTSGWESQGFDSDDQAAYLELQDCLEISEAMKSTIIHSIGGRNEDHQKLIRDSFHNGRFNAHRSHNMPDNFLHTSPEVFSKLKDYQKCGIHWLLTLHNAHRNGILADEMGLGKTAQTCVFFNHLYASELVRNPSIIATPASLLDNWLKEIELWAPDLKGRVMKYHGKQSERRELILDFIGKMNQDNKYYIIVTSINTLASTWDVQYLKQIKPLSYLAVDEAHSLKNQNSQVYRKLNKVYNSDRRLLLTGSPIQNRTNELRNLLLFVMPHVFEANSLDSALSYYEKQVKLNKTLSQKELKEQASESDIEDPKFNDPPILEELARYIDTKRSILSAPDVQCLQKVLAPFILRRLKNEVLNDLPMKRSVVIRCEIEGRQALLYLQEIKKRNSRLVLSLQKLRNLIDSPNRGKKAIPKPFSKGSDTCPNDVDSKIGLTELTEEDKENCEHEPNSGPGNKNQNNKHFVNSLISRLRRICNHPLMMQGYFTENQIQEVVDHYYLHVEGFMGNPRKKVEAEIRKWSDFEIHQGIQQLISINDLRLSHLLITKEALLDSAKIKRMIELVKEISDRQEKVLIFSQFTTYLNIIEEVLNLALPELQYLRLDGSTNVIERQYFVDRFNTDPQISVFMLSTKAGGQGLNLSAARNVILMDQDWNPHNDRQAEDRVHRLGQTKEVFIYRLCCRATIEETILECCQRKLDLDEAFGGDSELLQAAILQDSITNSSLIAELSKHSQM